MQNDELARKLVSWIRRQVESASGRGVVLGLSGGIDSAVLGVLCQRAFPENVMGLIMPCHSLPEDEEHARLLADKVNIPVKKVGLDAAYDILLRLLPDFQPDDNVANLARANLKARLRMVTLYHAANLLGCLVAGSGNRSELAIGYFTKFGDSGVDMLPLGNLVKGEVQELARYLGVPDEIIDKPPSAGLWEGQTDEQEMGFSYADLDRFILIGEAPEGLKEKLTARQKTSRHKCETAPIPRF